MDISCRAWRNCPAAEKTWDNFKADFTRDYLAYTEDLDETTSGTYQANMAQNNLTTEVINEIHQAAVADKDML